VKVQIFNTLDAVLRGGSLAAAAQEMNLTPSAVSMQMKQMEAYFGQTLFDRSSLQVRPTAFALELNRSLREVVGTVEAMRRRPTPVVQGRIRVGVIETMQASLLPDAMRYVRQRYPHLEVVPVRGRSAELLDGLKAGKMDATVVAQPEGGGSSRLYWQPLMRKDLVLVVPPEAKETSVDQLLGHYDLIGFDKTTIGGRLAARFLAERGYTRNAVMELQSTHAVVAMVSAGLGVSIILMPDTRVCKGYPVRIEPLGDHPPSMNIAIACRNADADNRQFRAVEEAFLHAVRVRET
jgi:DNA-binding transcriptional LysR family regulator